MVKNRSDALRLKLDALGPLLRKGALIYVVSTAEALGEALMAAAGVSSRLLNVPRMERPPEAPAPPVPEAPAALPAPARHAAVRAVVPANGRKTRAGLPAERRRSGATVTVRPIEVRPTLVPELPSPAHRFIAGVRRELEQAREAQVVPTRVRRDGRGRRLRASAYIYGPQGAKSARGRHHKLVPGVVGSALPAAVKVSLVVVAAGAAFLASSQAYIDYAAGLPDAHYITTVPVPEDSMIYAGDGSLLADIHPSGVHHYYEPLDKMGTYLPQATVAIEDSNFWNEPGIDPGAMARAAWVDWRQRKAVQGASTITQQLVKLRLIGGQLSLDRKLKEAILALQVEHTYSKRQILEQYLNTIFYSNNSQGSLAASRIYFHKETKDLTLGEASMLAGIPQSPLYNSPFGHPDIAKQRQHDVLSAMVKQKMITQDQADEAFAEDLSPPDHMFTEGSQVRTAFTNWIIAQLSSRYGDKATFGGGLRVVTTLNPTLQKLAQDTVVAGVAANRSRNAGQGAMVSVDPRTGAVLAMVGSANPDDHGGQFNMALVPRNPGSSFKIYNYTAAIESQKFTMVTPIADSPVSIDQPYAAPYQPKNYDLRYHGTCTFQQCMGNSLNVPAIKVEASIGIERVVDMARRMGAPPFTKHDDGSGVRYTTDDPASSFGYSLTLGGYAETVLQMATGASVLGAQGVYHQPFGIVSVKDSAGTEIATADPAKTARQVVDPKVAFIMEQIMSDNDNRQIIFGPSSANLLLDGRRAAAKTGTTDGFSDAWTVGYTPSLASAFWFGNPDGTDLTAGSDGVFVAAPAWKSYMQGALQDLNASPSEWFAEPPGLGHALVGGKMVYLMPGTSPNQAAPPLPPNVHSSSAPCSTSPKPGNNNNNSNNNPANKACPPPAG